MNKEKEEVTMAEQKKDKTVAKETAKRIVTQKKTEENARRVLASVCNSRTMLDEVSDDTSRKEFMGKYYNALKRKRDRFYASPREYGWILAYYRTKSGLSLSELSARVHIAVDSLEQFEEGRTVPEGGNKRHLEGELGFPKDMAHYVVDEAHNYLYGFRNYAPVVYDVCSASRENAETMLQGLHLEKKLLWLVSFVTAAILMCGVLFFGENADVARYCMMGGAGLTGLACLLNLAVIRMSIRHQTLVKSAFLDVAESLMGDSE